MGLAASVVAEPLIAPSLPALWMRSGERSCACSAHSGRGRRLISQKFAPGILRCHHSAFRSRVIRREAGREGGEPMPLAKIYVNEGQYDEARLTKISEAVQAALRGTLSVPPDDFFQLIFEMPRNRYLHTASFVGMEYTDDLVTLEILFVSGRSRETRLALLNDLDTRIAAAAGISPDDVFINLVEAPGENISFGQGEAQRANAVE